MCCQSRTGKENVIGQQGIYSSATWDAATKEIIVKVVNTSDKAQQTDIQLSGSKKLTGKGTQSVLKSDLQTVNSFEQPKKVQPAEQAISIKGKSLKLALDALFIFCNPNQNELDEMRHLILPVMLCCASLLMAQDIRVHDPVMIKAGDTYYLFCTGMGISVYSSRDMKQWNKEKPVFDTAPLWAVNTIPDSKRHIWAPDISFHNGQYYLYYSVSAFGKNTSCIGVATNTTLNPTDKNFKWVDHGKVIQSVPGRDLWNAIDPNLAYR